ncbi:MAG: hypothetical protein COX70_09170 [Flavobacteriales bacterium CG_4_10_14_0_2_um_filter_32_8]|nr:MAG: hypothetical protein COX70_09170 [Flavobacteriales bacterium CG_4_10_14_0_2_um_filter_32_8]PJB14767.1 MAG: hypothetical protein CO118_06880 [Flavobacteriales bacterium CG_4_9_14_3_um_filter_32_8]
MRLILFLFFSLFYHAIFFSQNYIDLAKFHYSNTPQNKFDSIGGTTNIEEFGADITFPIQLNNKNVVLSGLILEQIKLKIHPLADFTTISTINLKIGLNRNHSEKWNGTYLLLPKLSSNFEKITAKDFQLGGLILMKYNKNDNLKYNVGLYYNNELFGAFFVPLLGLYYKSKNDKLEANLTLPIWADVNYKLKNWLIIGTNFTAGVKSFYLENDYTYVVKKTNEIFGYLQFNINKSLLIQTKTGYSIGRSYRVYHENEKIDMGISSFRFGDHRTVLNPDFKDGLIFQIRLIYRFNLE